MRFTLVSLALASVVSAGWLTDCMVKEGSQLLAQMSCGDSDAIAACLADNIQQDEAIRGCLLAGDCSEEDADAEMAWLETACAAVQHHAPDEELRRRRPGPAPAATTTTDATMPTSPSTSAAILALRTPDAAQTPLVCMTTTTSITTSCVTTADATTCSDVTSLKSNCVDGLLCTTDSSGNTACMKREDNITTSGAVATVVLVTFLVGSIGSVIVMAIRSKRRDHRDAVASSSAHKAEQVSLLGHAAAPPVPFSSAAAAAPRDHLPPPAVPAHQNPFGDDIAYQSQSQNQL